MSEYGKAHYPGIKISARYQVYKKTLTMSSSTFEWPPKCQPAQGLSQTPQPQGAQPEHQQPTEEPVQHEPGKEKKKKEKRRESKESESIIAQS